MEKIFIEILNMSLTAAYVILFVFVARFFLKKTSKVFSYLLWAVVGFRLVVPFSFESVWSLLPSGGKAIPKEIGTATIPQITSGIPIVDRVVNQNLPMAVPTASSNPMQLWIAVGEAIWVVGMLVLISYSIFSFLLLKRQLRFACYAEKGIYIAEGLKTPFILGIIRPKIYLPSGLSEDEKAYVLLHEKTHLARYDHIVKLIAFLLLCIHWFNPLVWLAFIYMSRDMEMSCDEAVIRKLGHGVKQDYSTSLLSLAAGRTMLKGSPLAFGEGEVKGRIKNILSYKKPTLWVGLIGALALVILGLGLLANPIQAKGVPLLEASGMITEERFSSYHASAHMISEGAELVFQIDEIEKITDLQAFIQRLRVEKTEISLDRSEAREKDHQLIFYRFYQVDVGEVYLAYHFNEDFSTVWIDNGVKPSFSYRVIDPEGTKQFFTEFLQDQASNEWAEKLLSKQLKYVGNAPGVANIVSLLKFPTDMRLENGMELQTSEEPYGVILPFTLQSGELATYDTEQVQIMLREQAYIMLALIENVGIIEIRVADESEEIVLKVTREEAEQTKGEDVRNFTESIERFRTFLQGSILATNKVFALDKFDAVEQGQMPDEVQDLLTELQQYAQDYSSEQAIQDGLFVDMHGQYANEFVMEEFIGSCQAGKQTKITMVHYTREGDPIFTAISFDGQAFYTVLDHSRDKFGGGEFANQYDELYVLESTDGKHVHVVLTNEGKLTYEELTQRMLSSITPYDGQIIYSYEQ